MTTTPELLRDAGTQQATDHAPAWKVAHRSALEREHDQSLAAGRAVAGSRRRPRPCRCDASAPRDEPGRLRAVGPALYPRAPGAAVGRSSHPLDRRPPLTPCSGWPAPNSPVTKEQHMFKPHPSRFTLYRPESRVAVGHVGNSRMKGRAADAAYRQAEQRSRREGLVFDDTCPHGTAFDLCGC